jgi:S-DNA-T family DNA segregation ATPase FtsK/SpoIIIE
LNFILIDYKGGSAFDACVRLPHVVDVITDLDHEDGNDRSITRALRGLEAELRRRESVLRNLRCGSHDEYQHRKTSSDEPMPRLVIVVDELAALRAEVPEVVSALMTISQRGRSLGLHLIVATQRPGSELTPDVLANAPIRLALRLQTREDSMQVVGHPGAADLPRYRPGRALLRLSGQVPEEFQSIYVADELSDLVAMAESVARDMNLPQPRRPWCEQLAAHLAPTASREPFSVGVVDDPDRQSQFPLRWNPERHLLVMAGPHSGKTWSLYTLSAISQIDESEARHFYISGRGDHDLGSSWVAVTDRERLQRTLTYLGKAIEERRIQQGDFERITVFIDDVDLWRSQHTDGRLGTLQWDSFERVVVEGSSVGVVCVFTATHDHSLPALIKSRIDQRWLPGHRPGSFEVILPNSSSRLSAQLFDPKFFAENLENLTQASELQCGNPLTVLPTNLKSHRRVSLGSFGQHADDLREVCLDSRRELKSLILGPRGSGRTTALTALVQSWKDLHPTGVISSIENPICDSVDPILVVIDDADRRFLAPVLLNQVMKSLTLNNSLDGDSSLSVSIVATASPHALRTQADHWLQALRRYRTGFLLGRCAEEDGDLLGHYARHLSFVPPAVSRGLWIDDGESQGVVQFFDHS